MFSFFKKPEPIENDDLGTLSYQDSEWISELRLPHGDAELAIDGDKKGPDTFALNYAIEIHPRIADMWLSVIEFSRAKLKGLGWEDDINTDDFVLHGVAVHKEGSFDGGHLSFWFDFEPDKNGSYYVSFRDESPFYFHRDN